MRIDGQNISINFKHMSDDFMEKFKDRLIEMYVKSYKRVIVVCDRHTKSFFDTMPSNIILVEQ